MRRPSPVNELGQEGCPSILPNPRIPRSYTAFNPMNSAYVNGKRPNTGLYDPAMDNCPNEKVNPWIDSGAHFNKSSSMWMAWRASLGSVLDPQFRLGRLPNRDKGKVFMTGVEVRVFQIRPIVRSILIKPLGMVLGTFSSRAQRSASCESLSPGILQVSECTDGDVQRVIRLQGFYGRSAPGRMDGCGAVSPLRPNGGGLQGEGKQY